MNRLIKYTFSAIVAASAFAASQSASAAIDIKAGPTGEVALVVNFDVKKGAEADFESVFRRSVTCSRKEPGNITFNVVKVIGAERSYVLYEVWRSKDALSSHFERPYTKALFSMFERNLTRPLTEGAGGLHFVTDLAPSPRTVPATTDPSDLAECR
ncbi:antibiotic biosynthesis monooxygenase family protein (plasmid) [Cedecea neteri]|uniref:putative quinol monooxygenase n=1 Tax=Cedecea neteri TaxID=158822 RepID=UPI00289356C6|nr:antibiotic biosynthesis monooxygenase family protein [Cedecea neteri]WNJ82197.1 antibiotic biosynthesis monooxygenase family protein [Cedecea neteri]